MSKHKQTKIVATIGPATETEEVLEQLIVAGMNVARFNTKHSDPKWHNSRIERVRKVSEKLNKSVAVLLDLQGPEIRINLPEEKPFDVKSGDDVIFTSNENHSAKNYVIVPQNVIESLNDNDQILLEDGACEFIVQTVSGNELTAQALVDCKVQHRKTMNTPGVILDMPSLTDRDYGYLDGVEADLIDYIGLSFVRDANDIKVLKKEMEKRGIKAGVIAKIENQAAVDNIDEIIEASEGIMVARGDLGVEVAYEELSYWQKQIIEKCRQAAKPVITATQMLKSMVDSPRPTRAEVSDVANAIYDGSDAVMLSDETTIGKYPVKCVTTQATIASFNEPHAYKEEMAINNIEKTSAESAMTHAANAVLKDADIEIDKIVCLTETGHTARLLARFRNLTPIVALTSNDQTKRALALTFGVDAYTVDLSKKNLESADTILESCKEIGVVNKGENVLFVFGSTWKNPGLTNTITVLSA